MICKFSLSLDPTRDIQLSLDPTRDIPAPRSERIVNITCTPCIRFYVRLKNLLIYIFTRLYIKPTLYTCTGTSIKGLLSYLL